MNSRYIVAIGMITLAAAIFYIGFKFSGNKTFDTNRSSENIEVSDSISIAGVKTLITEGAFEVEIVASNRNVMISSYDKSSIRNKTRIEGDELRIDFDVSKSDFLDFKSKKSARVILYTNDISTLVNIGAGTIYSDDTLVGHDFSLSNEGVGSIEFKVKVGSVVANNNGVGSMEIVGKTKVLSISNAGLGSVNTSELMARKAVVSNAGVGSVEVYASDSLSLSNDGVGSIEYSGDGMIYEMSNNGIGSIDKK